MGAYNDERSNRAYYSLKAKTSDTDPTPYIGKSEKQGDSWSIAHKYNAIVGWLFDIKHGTYEYEGQVKNKVELFFTDHDEKQFVLSANFNSLTYSLLNSLASCHNPGPGWVDINVWLGKAKVTNGVAGKQYPSVALKNNGQKVKWAYLIDEIPKATKETYKGNVIIDDSAVIKFWVHVIDNDIKPRLKPFTPTLEPLDEAVDAASDVKLPPAIGGGGDDLPF